MVRNKTDDLRPRHIVPSLWRQQTCFCRRVKQCKITNFQNSNNRGTPIKYEVSIAYTYEKI